MTLPCLALFRMNSSALKADRALVYALYRIPSVPQYSCGAALVLPSLA
jgi:hypothetical protein